MQLHYKEGIAGCESHKANFRSREPVHESRMGAGLRRIKDWAVRSLLGIQLVTAPMMAAGIAATVSSCESQKQQDKIGTDAEVTDANGTAVFSINDQTFTIHVYDLTTQEPIPGLVGILMRKRRLW